MTSNSIRLVDRIKQLKRALDNHRNVYIRHSLKNEIYRLEQKLKFLGPRARIIPFEFKGGS